jgi:hypothetical protein
MNRYIHSRFIPEGVAETSLRDTHILAKLLSYAKYCRCDSHWHLIPVHVRCECHLSLGRSRVVRICSSTRDCLACVKIHATDDAQFRV